LRRSAEHGFTSLRRSAEHGFTSLRRSAEHGFTLIEMMVALAIFGVAALALIRLEGATLKSAGAIEVHTLGEIVVQNIAVARLSDPAPPAFGMASGSVTNGGRTWHWTQATQHTADPRIVRIDIAVADLAGRPAGALTLARPVR
jgi:general secretion pathway protein I